jgi:hypothetical protein
MREGRLAMEADLLSAVSRVLGTRQRRDLERRLHDLEVQLVALRAQVRQVEQQLLASDVDQLRRRGL